MRLVALAAAAVLLAGSAQAATQRYASDLTGLNEVPSNTTKGKGHVDATLDTVTKTFSWSISYNGLTGPATMAHFHGPATTVANAPPIITITGLASPMKGSQVLTDAQIADLQAGKWYFNIHTAANPGGEIRAQVTLAH